MELKHSSMPSRQSGSSQTEVWSWRHRSALHDCRLATHAPAAVYLPLQPARRDRLPQSMIPDFESSQVTRPSERYRSNHDDYESQELSSKSGVKTQMIVSQVGVRIASGLSFSQDEGYIIDRTLLRYSSARKGGKVERGNSRVMFATRVSV